MRKAEAALPPEAAAEVREDGQERFSREALLRCGRWAGRRDALSFLLREGQAYSHREVEEALKSYLDSEEKG